MNTAYIISGPPGAGKTTYGKRLAAETKAALLDIDTVTETIVRAGLVATGHNPDDRDSLWFKTHFREPIYETLFTIAKENLPVQDVVIVGPFTHELQDPNWPNKLEERLEAKIEVHFVTCPPNIRRQRMVLRGEPRDLAKLEEWETHKAYYGDESPPLFCHTLIDNR